MTDDTLPVLLTQAAVELRAAARAYAGAPQPTKRIAVLGDALTQASARVLLERGIEIVKPHGLGVAAGGPMVDVHPLEELRSQRVDAEVAKTRPPKKRPKRNSHPQRRARRQRRRGM